MGAEAVPDSRGVTLGVTTTTGAPTRSCPICEATFTLVGRRRYCSDRCRARAYRRRLRQTGGAPELPVPPPGGVRARSIYECPSCQERYLGEQRCPECGVFCSRVGLGGACPHCQEPVAVADLIDPAG